MFMKVLEVLNNKRDNQIIKVHIAKRGNRPLPDIKNIKVVMTLKFIQRNKKLVMMKHYK